jgi:ABC-2 type transport system permease protein
VTVLQPARRVAAIAALLSRGGMRQPALYVAVSAIPASYFLLMWLLGGAGLGRHALVGALVAFAVNAGIVALPQTVLAVRWRHLDELLLASPVSRPQFVAAVALSRVWFIAPPLLVAYAVFLLVDRPGPLAAALVLGCLGVAFTLSCTTGYALAARWHNPVTISAVANMAGLLTVLLPPVYYPVSLLPGWLQWPALLVPTASLADLTRAVSGLSAPSAGRLAGEIAVVGAAIALAARYLRRLEGPRP